MNFIFFVILAFLMVIIIVLITNVNRVLLLLNNNLTTIIMDLKSIQDQVTAESTVVDSAVTLLKGLKSQLDAAIASNDPKALQALSDAIGTQTNALAQAVAANTPAAV